MKTLRLVFPVCCSLAFAAMAVAVDVRSPDGVVTGTLTLNEVGEIRYSVSYRGQPVIADSALALVIKDAAPFQGGLKIITTKTERRDTVWKPVYGERSKIRDRFNSVAVQLQERDGLSRRLTIEIRAYDEGLAFRYEIPKQKTLDHIQIAAEHSEFRFLDNHVAWAAYRAQAKYARVRLNDIHPGCERPLTLEINKSTYGAVAEARLVDYARMKLSRLPNVENALVSQLDGEVDAKLPLVTPWRIIMLADSPGQLLQNNDIILNLNDPCDIKDTSWIKPGKVIREVTLTTVGGKACIDFAVKRNLQYVEFDAGWYGSESDAASDATTISVDSKRSRGPLDLHEVIQYAKERNIGIIVYVNRRALERQLDTILPLYQEWGIKGVKYGFVNVGSQQWTTWLHDAIRKAAAHRLMVDVHDEYRPTGYSRTYPNFMTQEGIGGDETSPSNDQTLTILFTRMLAGAGDNTICYYDQRVTRNASHAYQLAKSVCIYSPWQFLYWYDRPATSPSKAGGAGGSQHQIGDEPELEFFDRVPTVWDETTVLKGAIGEYAIIARRSGSNWYIGGMNSGPARSFEIPLDFLQPNVDYHASVYSDDPSIATRTHVRIDRKTVRRETTLRMELGENGGQAVRISPSGE